jgi:hypothetical protein
MELLGVHQLQLMWKADGICARLGCGDRNLPAGHGSTLPEALRDLANVLDSVDLKVWVPKSAKPYVEDGACKVTCPECGAVHTSDFEHVIAFVCNNCGLGVDVENE